MRSFGIIALALLYSFVSSGEETENAVDEIETREVPLELLNELHGAAHLFVYESLQHRLDLVSQAHLFYIVANESDPEVFRVVMKATLESMRSDLELVIESPEAKEHQVRRAKKMLEGLKESGVFQ